MVHEDAVDESKLTLCCALCCANCSTMATCGCSGRVGLCCTNIEFCCKVSSLLRWLRIMQIIFYSCPLQSLTVSDISFYSAFSPVPQSFPAAASAPPAMVKAASTLRFSSAVSLYLLPSRAPTRFPLQSLSLVLPSTPRLAAACPWRRLWTGTRLIILENFFRIEKLFSFHVTLI